MFMNIIIVFFTMFVLVTRWQRRRKIWCCAQFNNDLSAPPIVGHAVHFLKIEEDKGKVFRKFARQAIKHGGITSLHSWIADKFYIVIADPVAAEVVLRNHLNKTDTIQSLGNLFQGVLSSVPVHQWRPRRKMINVTFATKHLNQYVKIFRKSSDRFIDGLRKVGDEFSVYKYISEHVYDSLCETTFGTEGDALKNSGNITLTAIHESPDLIAKRMRVALLHNDYIYNLTLQCRQLKKHSKVMTDFARMNIQQKRKEFERGLHTIEKIDQDTRPMPLHQLLVEASKGDVSEEYLVNETKIMLFAGNDTTSVTLSFACVLLARYPDVQENVYRELIDILGDSDKPVEAEDLPRFKYMDAVLKETMRLYPPVMLLMRKIDKDTILPSGQTLVKDMEAMINMWAIHRNPQYWGEDAEQFRPERFLDYAPRHPAAFIPFSYGPRNCIGYHYAMLLMKTTLSSLLRQYRLLPVSNGHYMHEHMRTHFDIVIRCADNFPLRLVNRRQ